MLANAPTCARSTFPPSPPRCGLGASAGLQLKIPTWGFGGQSSDFAIAYEKAAAVILGIKPTYLVFAQGLTAGRDLRPAKMRPLTLRAGSATNGPVVRDRLVYEVHEYPFLYVRTDDGGESACVRACARA